MPRSYQDIIDQAAQLSQKFEDGFVPAETPEVAALRAASFKRAQAEVELFEAVKHAVEAGEPWKAIGEAVGTTGEAARQRYRKLAYLRKAKPRRRSGQAGPSSKQTA